MSQARLSYRPDIDGLRAVAVLSVLFSHAGLGFPGGYVGVDVFFVISGFLITRIILKELQQGAFSLRGFWERRIRRILPALAVVTAASVIAGWFILLPDDYRKFGASLVSLTLLVSNAYFWRTTGYFEAEADRLPLLHTWSLAVEEQFYLLFPLFVFALYRGKQMRRATGALALLVLLSFVLGVYGTYVRPSTSTFYLPLARTWELLAGAILALAPERPQGSPRLRDAASVAGLALILVPCLLYHEQTVFPGPNAAPPVLGAVLLIWAGSGAERLPLVNRALAWSPVVFVGLISYSLYLWHWPVLVFAAYANAFPLDAATRIGLCVLSVALATASWRYVEVPFRNRKLLSGRGAPWYLAAATGAAGVAAGVLLIRTDGAARRVSPEILRTAAYSRVDRRYVHELNARDVPDRLPTLGDSALRPEVLVWGDSHAMAVLPAIEALCRERGKAARVAAHSATAPAIGYAANLQYGLNAEAPAFNAAVLEYVRSAKVRSVLLAANWNAYVRDAAFADAMKQTVDALRSAGARVYVMKTVPGFDFDVPRTLALYRMQGRPTTGLAVGAETHERSNSAFNALCGDLSARGAVLIDPATAWPSNASMLLPFDSGGPFYRDGHHLSTYGALAIKEIFAPAFD